MRSILVLLTASYGLLASLYVIFVSDLPGAFEAVVVVGILFLQVAALGTYHFLQTAHKEQLEEQKKANMLLEAIRDKKPYSSALDSW